MGLDGLTAVAALSFCHCTMLHALHAHMEGVTMAAAATVVHPVSLIADNCFEM